MKFATITPDRGDRPELLEFCRHQIHRFTTQPARSYFISTDPAPGGKVDIIPRVKEGIRRAANDGFDLVFIIENDDFYPRNYFDFIPDADFYGCRKTTYYNLLNRTWQTWSHPGRSSLFTTGFKISALEKSGFRWPADDVAGLDIRLWAHINKGGSKVNGFMAGAIGIKHGIGKTGGRGHTMKMDNHDPDLSWLKAHVDQEAYVFYKTLKLPL